MAIPLGGTVANLPGKQVGLPAVTSKNNTSTYAPSFASTNTIGSVSVTRQTTVNNTASGGNSLAWSSPTYSTDSTGATVMTCNGTQSICYQQTNSLHTATPYSAQVDFKTTDVTKGVQFILDNGEGFGIGWSEWCFQLQANALRLGTNSNATANGQGWYDFSINIQNNTWYRAGFMMWSTNSTTFFIRGYLNGVQVFQRQIAPNGSNGVAHGSNLLGTSVLAVADAMPSLAANGISIGADANNYNGRMFFGQIRNVFIGPGKLFWTI